VQEEDERPVLTTLLGADATTIGARKRAREEDKEEGEVDPEAGEEEVAVKVACSHAHARRCSGAAALACSRQLGG